MDLLDASLGDIAVRLRELLENDRSAVLGSALSGDDLLASASAWEAIGQAGDTARTWVAAEIAHESRRELDTAGLAYRHGFPTAKKLLAATTNTSERTAATRIHLGQRLRSSLSNTGIPNPSFFPVVEAAFYTGQIGVDAAAVICRTLSEVVTHTMWTEATDQAERHLVACAVATVVDPEPDLGAEDTMNDVEDGSADETSDLRDSRHLPRRYTVEEIGRLAIRIREHLDPDGSEPRDAVKQSLRGFSYPRVGADGMARGRYALPPLQLGVFLTAIDSILSPRTPNVAPPDAQPSDGSEDRAAAAARNANTTATDTTAPADEHMALDSRTSEQKLLDAVMTLIELAAGSPAASRLNGAAPTINVHVTLDDLKSGRGVGWIDGSTEPIPISTIEALQCDGDTIVTLFGTHGEVLNHGKTHRLATRRQRRALAARDGGCVIPGCTTPPSRCQTHHLVPWVSADYQPGRTDLDNLALLCPFHHSTIHTSAWTLVMIHGTPHIRPPSWYDPKRTPRPTGQQRTGTPW